MPKRGLKTVTTKVEGVSGSNGRDNTDAVSICKDGGFLIKVHAKPGAKYSAVTGLTEEGYGVQISAPPVDGEANQELVKFFSKLLDVKKSEVCLHRGMKSREKVVKICSTDLTVEKIQTILAEAGS